MNYNDEFDHVLDDALAEYRDAGPLAGMEQRVLQRVRLHAERPRKLWQWWGAFALCTVMLAITVWIGLRDRARHQTVPLHSAEAQQQRPPVEPQPMNASTQSSRKPAPGRALAAKVHSPSPRIPGQTASADTGARVRREFPTPAPPNPEERALLALAQTHPEVLSQLSNGQDDQEIAIAPINIQPLGNETSRKQGEN